MGRAAAALGLFGIACSASPAPAAAPVAERPTVREVGCIAMTVADARASAELFTRVLDFRATREEAHHARVDLGTECVELDEPPSGAVRRSIPADSKSNDLWFQHVAIVVSDMDAAYARLEANHLAHVSAAPQTLPAWNANAGGIRAFYFHDADGHVLELIAFPPGKGQPRWQEKGALFLGIDHTAIAVSDTRASERFYTELGMRVAGRSENWGPEQEALNAVPGAHLRITGLRAAGGPGVELLEYLAPKGGRPFPTDDTPDDLVYWRTTLFADGVSASRTLRDPDGHVMEVHPR